MEKFKAVRTPPIWKPKNQVEKIQGSGGGADIIIKYGSHLLIIDTKYYDIDAKKKPSIGDVWKQYFYEFFLKFQVESNQQI